MKRTGYVIVAIAAALAVAAALVALASGRREWTTDSREALAAWEAGLEARMRFYQSDALAGFHAALAADPGFVAPKVLLLQTASKSEERESLVADLRAADRSRLSERERFLLDLALAHVDADPPRAERLVEDFLARRPRDPWALFTAANIAWERADGERAEELYARLLKVDPNWVIAHNNLGYLAMAREQFAEAEKHFRTYAYVAPDQANPHDSLGELLVLIGRYDEARAELEAALAVRPDFCASYGNLIGIALMKNEPEQFEPVLARIDRNCSAEQATAMRCEAQLLEAFLANDFDAPWRDTERFACLPEHEPLGPIYHRLALLSGHSEPAAAEEQKWIELARKLDERGRGKGSNATASAMVSHLAGVRQLAEGRPSEAVASFRAADERAQYWGLEQGRLKLFNLANLALALERAGDHEGSRAALERLRAVNAPFVVAYDWLVDRTPEPASR